MQVDITIYLSRDLEKPPDRRIMQRYRLEPLMINHNPAKFGDHIHCGSGGVFNLYCYLAIKLDSTAI